MKAGRNRFALALQPIEGLDGFRDRPFDQLNISGLKVPTQ
jgi:hypothetical protein